MAFTTTQSLDNALLRNLTFRTMGNAAISSQYTLYANGIGQTYWSNSVSPTDLSTLSTSYGIAVSTLSTSLEAVYHSLNSNVSSLSLAIGVQSSQLASTNLALYSSVSSLIRTDVGLASSINALSLQFNVLCNTLAIQIGANYTSTINYLNSTLQGISTTSTFTNEISAVQSSVNAGLSTLSTTIGVQNESTYSSITYNYTSTLTAATVSTTKYIDQQIGALSTTTAYQTDLSTFSSIITQQLLSTSEGLASTANTNFGAISSAISTVNNSTLMPLESTVLGLSQNVADLDLLSTNLYSTTYLWISTFVSTSQSYQDIAIYSTIAKTNECLDYLTGSTTRLMSAFSTFSSTTVSTINTFNSTTGALNSSILSLQDAFSTITTSTILAGIYDTFIQLEDYTSTLIGSTIASVTNFKSSLYYSTTIQNASISQSYFNFYVSTLYLSTLSTLIPSTLAFTSTLVSTLYSTGFTIMMSSLNSTTVGVSAGFTSTTSSIAQFVLVSTQLQLNSSILGYLSTPAGQNISTFSTNQYVALSTFTGTGATQLNTQSTIFGSQLNTLSTLFISTTSLYTSLSTQLRATTLMMSSFSTQFAQQQSTQVVQFNSTIVSYPAQLTSSINSTNTAAYAFATSSATSTLNNIQTSTTAAYNTFVAGLNAQAQTAALSSLYTNQALTLTGTTFTAPLDVVNYRNFTINVYGLLNGTSNYGITYLSNNIQTLNYRKGIITIDISTVGTFYSTPLRFDVYRWGLPTSVFGNVYPTVSNSDYMLQYEYTILNQVIYTNLLNVYPRLRTRNPQISSIVKNVVVGNLFGFSSNIFWRGTPFQVSWSNYSFFPMGQLGAPPFNPTVNIDLVVAGSTVSQFGPYPLSVSTATVRTPYLQNQAIPLVQTTVLTYITGNYTNAASTLVTTAIPQFTNVQVYSPNFPNSQLVGFAGGTELVAQTEQGAYPLYNVFANLAANSGLQSFNNNPTYSLSNLFRGQLNAVGAAGKTPSNLSVTPTPFPLLGQMTEVSAGAPGFYVHLGSYFTYMNALQSLGATFTFTFSNVTTSYTFPAPLISSINQSTSLYLLSNSAISKASPTFTSGSCALTYTYTSVPALTATAGYTPSTFIGPISAGTPDSAVYIDVPTVPLATNDALSTLTFYNVLTTDPIAQSTTANTQISLLLTYGGTYYASTVFTTTSGSAQIFRF